MSDGRKSDMKSSITYDSRWLRLDNAAKIYPVVATEKNSGVFRVAATLNQTIDPELLERSVIDCRDRFPSFYVKLRQGIFWFYYEPNEKNPIIRQEPPYLCEKMQAHKNNDYLFKFFYFQNRISLEVFHSLSDGTGAIALLKTVILRYLTLQGHQLINDGSVIACDERPKREEIEDSYNALYTKKLHSKFSNEIAYRIEGEKFRAPGGIGLVSASVETEALKRLAKANGASMTEFLVTLLNYAVIRSGDPKKLSKRPVRISVPVNMRRFLYSRSLRNFSLFFNTTIRAKGNLIEFSDLLPVIKAQFKKELVLERLQDRLNSNVAFEKNVLIKIVPLFLKKLFFKIGYAIIGHRPTTISLTNFGEVVLPETMRPFIDSFDFNLASGKKPGSAVISYGQKTKIIFNRPFKGTELERTFITYLSDQGLDVAVESNNWR